MIAGAFACYVNFMNSAGQNWEQRRKQKNEFEICVEK